MGNTLPTAVPQAHDLRTIFQQDLPQFVYVDLIGRGKFLKTVHCKHVPRDATGKIPPGESSISVPGRAVVKVYYKRGDQKRRIAEAREQLALMCRIFNLRDQPNIVPYQRFDDSPRNECAYLVRQHFAYNLYDRVNSRPFLTRQEKLWLMFQLIKAVAQAHAAGVRHGDIKAENVLITSWGWLLLSDFATFKPTYLAEDSPADFLFFFDAGNRARCCLAPERLVKARDLESMRALPEPAVAPTGEAVPAVCDPALREAMDVFSLGCTLVELSSDGDPLFDFGTLLTYKQAGGGTGGVVGPSMPGSVPSISLSLTTADTAAPEPDPLATPVLATALRETDPSGALREMVSNMVSRNPAKRASAAHYLDVHTAKGSLGALVPLNVPSGGALPLPLARPMPLPWCEGGGVAGSADARLFPSYFSFLHVFMARLIQPDMSVAGQGASSGVLASADLRILTLAACYSDLLLHVTGGAVDPLGEILLRKRLVMEWVRGEPVRRILAELVPTAENSVTQAAKAIARRYPASHPMTDKAASTGISVSLLQGGRQKRKTDCGSGLWGPPVILGEEQKKFGVGARAAVSAAQDLGWDWGYADGCDTPWLSGSSSSSVSTLTDPELDWIVDPIVRARCGSLFSQGLCGTHERWAPQRWAWVAMPVQASPAGPSEGVEGSEVVEGQSRADARPVPGPVAPVAASGRTGSILGLGTMRKASTDAASAVGGMLRDGEQTPHFSGEQDVMKRANKVVGQAGRLLAQLNEVSVSSANVTSGCSSAPKNGRSSVGGAAGASAPSSTVPALRLVPGDPATVQSEGLALLLALATSSVRFVTCPRTKLTALLLISRLTAWADDDTRLQRVVPYLTTQLSDPSAPVRAHALAALTCALEPLAAQPEEELSLAAVFPQYILPLVARLAVDTEPLVQMACAECIPRIVTLAHRFLEVATVKNQMAALRKAMVRAGLTSTGVTASATGTVPIPSSPGTSLGPASAGLTADTDDGVQIGSPAPSMLVPAAATILPADIPAQILSATRIKGTFDGERVSLRRRVHVMLSKWLGSATEEAASAATDIVLSGGAITEWLVNTDRSASSPVKAGGNAADLASLGRLLEPHALFSVSALASVSRAVRMLPCSIDVALLRRCIMHRGGMEALSSFYGSDGTQGSLLPLFLTFLVDPAAAAVLNTLSGVPALLPALMPAAGHPLAAGTGTGAGIGGAVAWHAHPLATQPIMSTLVSWLSRGPVGSGDWMALVDFTERAVRLALRLGIEVVKSTLLPFLDQLATCALEPVSHAALMGYARLIRYGLLQHAQVCASVGRAVSLMVHPSRWIQAGAEAILASAAVRLGWPRVCVDMNSSKSADARLNSVLEGTRGEAMWREVRAKLLAADAPKPVPSWHACPLESALAHLFRAATVQPLSRASYDAAAHVAAIGRLRRMSQGLDARMGAMEEALEASPQADETPAGEAETPPSPASTGKQQELEEGEEGAIGSEDAAAVLSRLARALPGHALDSLVHSATASGPFASFAPYAAPLASAAQRREYLVWLLKDHLASSAGPYRLSASTAGRMADAAARQAVRVETEAVRAASLSATSAAQPTPTPEQAQVLVILKASMGVGVSDAACATSGASAQPWLAPPYSDSELAIFVSRVRSISFPDQRYASVHPQPPSAAGVRVPNPQNEVPPPSVGEADCEDGGAPVTGGDGGTSGGGAINIDWAAPDAEHMLASNPPLPEDAEGYLQAILAALCAHRARQHANTGTLAASSSSVGGRRPRSRSRGSSFSVALVPVSVFNNMAGTGFGARMSVSAGVGSGPASPPLRPGRDASGTSRINSFVSFALEREALPRVTTSGGSELREQRQQSALGVQPPVLPLPPLQYAALLPVLPATGQCRSHLLLATKLRSAWRRAGRSARCTYLRHGIWAPLLATDTAFAAAAGTLGVNTTTAFFYSNNSSGRGGQLDDPGLYDSDEGDSASGKNSRASPRGQSRKSMAMTTFLSSPLWTGSMYGPQSPSSGFVQVTSDSPAASMEDALGARGGREGYGYAGYGTASTTDPGTGGMTTLPTAEEGEDEDDDGGGGEGAFEPAEIVLPAGAGDTRVTPAAMAARFSASAHAAITASEGNGLPPSRPGPGSLSASAFTTGSSTPISSTSRNMTSSSMAPTMGSGPGGPSLSGARGKGVAGGGATAGSGRLGGAGGAASSMSSAVQHDASFVTAVYEAEQIVAKAGAFRSRRRSVSGGLGMGGVEVVGTSGGKGGLEGGGEASSTTAMTLTAVSMDEGDMEVPMKGMPNTASGLGVVINPSYMGADEAGGSGLSAGGASASAAFLPGARQGADRARRSIVSFPPAEPLLRSRSIGASESTGSVEREKERERLARAVSQSASQRGGDDRDYLPPPAFETLSRRVRALAIPPLPPNLGCLQKNSEPPAPLCAHAVRVATGIPLFSWSSCAVGVGGGGLAPADPKAPGTFVSTPASGTGSVTVVIADEAARLGSTPEAGAELLVRGTLLTTGAPGQVCVRGPLSPFAADSSVLSPHPSPHPHPSALTLDVQSGAAALLASLGLPLGPDGVQDCPAAPIIPVPLPLPERDEIGRPFDVGDGSGYQGSGRVSFLGVEAGWHDGVGVGAPPNATLSSTIGLLPSPAGSVDRREGAYTAAGSAQMSGSVSGAPEIGSVGASSVSGGSMGGGGGPAWDGVSGTWGSRPRGLLLATLDEHTGGITALSVAGDHSFFASAGEDGLVKVWSTKGLDRDCAPASVLTYGAHVQEASGQEIERRGFSSSGSRVPAVTDVIVLDNTSSIASGSAAGCVHVWRVDISAAGKGGGSGTVGKPAGVREDGGSVASGTDRSGSFFSGNANTHGHGGTFGGYAGRQTHTNSLALPRFSSRVDGPDGERDDDRGSEWGGSTSFIRMPDGASLVRRLVFPAVEGAVAAVRHFDTHSSSLLACAMAGGTVHGVDLRSRVEAWAWRLPPELGAVTAMEVAPGSTAVLIGTDRGVLALYDTRAHLAIAAWRHSARSPITALYPYVTLRVRSGRVGAVLGECRSLAAGVACGAGDTAFFDLETGECTRLLRSLPKTVTRGEAFNPPFLLPIIIVAGRVAGGEGAAGLPPVHCVCAAADELSRPVRMGVRSILAPLPTSMMAGLGSGAPSSLNAGLALDRSALDRDDTLVLGLSGSDSGPGLGFVLGGIRGAGAMRRPRPGYEYGYARGATGHGTGASVVPLGAGAGDPVWRFPTAVPDPSSPAAPLLGTTGGGPGEGLPVWLLTAGEDGSVRCWDMDRPRAGFTVCGLAPAEARDGYEGAWMLPPPPARGEEDAVRAHESTGAHDREPYKLWHQRGTPIRSILSQPLHTPLGQDETASSGLTESPYRKGRGPVPAPTFHTAPLTALAWVDMPVRLMLTGSKDGVVKVWR